MCEIFPGIISNIDINITIKSDEDYSLKSAGSEWCSISDIVMYCVQCPTEDVLLQCKQGIMITNFNKILLQTIA